MRPPARWQDADTLNIRADRLGIRENCRIILITTKNSHETDSDYLLL